MKTKIYFAAAAMSAIALFNGCAKDGDPGPAGANGTNGTNGNANMSTQTGFILQSQWNQSGCCDLAALIPDSDVTQNIVDRGDVRVYISYGLNYWYGIPALLAGGAIWDTNHSLYAVRIDQSNLASTLPTAPDTLFYKIIVTAPN